VFLKHNYFWFNIIQMNLLFFFFKNEDGKEGEREREREAPKC
jgi:hypothetical protein